VLFKRESGRIFQSPLLFLPVIAEPFDLPCCGKRRHAGRHRRCDAGTRIPFSIYSLPFAYFAPSTMKKLALVILLAAPVAAPAQPAEAVRFSYIESLLDAGNDTTYVLNFWATWCKPCVAELPGFVRFARDHAGEKVRVVLVSLDFADELDTKLNPFLVKNGIDSGVVLLDELNYNAWIDRVSPEWGGAIPATLLVYGPGRNRRFHEGELTYDELVAWVGQATKTENQHNIKQ
jgi:thiol-disulfide isomerase/thioredoxin